jgi:hypothetical protein
LIGGKKFASGGVFSGKIHTPARQIVWQVFTANFGPGLLRIMPQTASMGFAPQHFASQRRLSPFLPVTRPVGFNTTGKRSDVA